MRPPTNCSSSQFHRLARFPLWAALLAWRVLIMVVAARTGAKGRGLFHPLRLALTGRGDGPELKKLLPLIGRAKALARLEGKPA